MGRFALWKNPEELTARQREQLAWVAATDPQVHRGYLLKEGLRLVFQMPLERAGPALERVGSARESINESADRAGHRTAREA